MDPLPFPLPPTYLTFEKPNPCRVEDKSFRIHHRNLQKIAIEIVRIVKLGLAYEIMKSVSPII